MVSSPYLSYEKWISEQLYVLDKDTRQYLPFYLNKIQQKFICEATGRDIILKARQQGFSSLILGIYTADFILKENSLNVIVADIADNAQDLLGRVKGYIQSYEEINKFKIPLKYNSKYELENAINGSRYIIGTAENTHFGRSKTITNLHMSEAAFYNHLKELLAGAGTALVPNGRFVIETTANGYNEFKELWDNSLFNETGFNPLFYKASDFYSADFLEREKMRLGNLFKQEYPETPEEAFLTSGDMFFDRNALEYYMDKINERKQQMANLQKA